MATASIEAITSTAAAGFAIGRNGATNPVVQHDCSVSSAATGLKTIGRAAAAGVDLLVISSGTNESLKIDAKGSGTIDLNTTGTGAINAKRDVAVTGKVTGTSADAAALAIGPNGATNPTLKINAATGSAATGVEVVAAAAAAGATLRAISSGTNEPLLIEAKGSGGVDIGTVSTGAIGLKRNTAVTGTLGVSGALSAASSVKSAHATAGIGYATGAGGAVTQGTSRTTAVELNTVAGAITLVSAAGSLTPASFTVTNSAVAATDVVVLSQKSGTDIYDLSVSAVADGSFRITFNTKSGTTTEQPVINFAVIKGVAA